jgi:hypothetical protein
MKLWLLGITFSMLALAAYLIMRWWRYGGGRQLLLSLPLQNWPDFKKWDQRNEFKLDEAAALWLDAEPRIPMWWRACWKLHRLRDAIAARMTATPSQPIAAAELGVRQASVVPHAPVHRDTLRALAEKEGVHPLFLYPEFRYRSRDRDKETNGIRLASIHESVLCAIRSVECELGGLRARLKCARHSSATVIATVGNGSNGGPDDTGRARVEVRLLAPEKRLDELKDHLATLRRIESAVTEELYS